MNKISSHGENAAYPKLLFDGHIGMKFTTFVGALFGSKLKK